MGTSHGAQRRSGRWAGFLDQFFDDEEDDVEYASERAVWSPPSRPSGGIAGALAELQRVHNAGLITGEEFATKRREILDLL